MYVINSNLAAHPPMGWNSWDCFGVDVREEEVRENAVFMAKHLKAYGWEYIVVDLGWYAPEATRHNYKEPKIPMRIDPYGRLMPIEERFPSAAGGKGFRPLADYVHSLGLKFGIHIMRGIPWIAVEENTPIKNSMATAAEIANAEDTCLWFNSMYGVNTTVEGGQAYYDSLLELYASWHVDFIKADDLGFWDGDGMMSPYRVDEVEALSQAVFKCDRDIVLSLSPGAAYIGDTNHLRRHAHMWRISCDFWDDWEALKRQFPRCARWASRICTGHWPDADMLPLGQIGIRGEIGTTRQTNFTRNEQYTLMTLWCIFRSPLMFGGHFPGSDPFSIQLITNPEVIAVNQQSRNNREWYRDEEQCIWIADDDSGSAKYLALFNLADQERKTIGLDFAQCALDSPVQVRDLWKREEMGKYEESFQFELPPHGAGLFRLSPIHE